MGDIEEVTITDVVLRIVRIVLFILALSFGNTLFAQIPSNDSCHNSIEITLGTGGYEIGTYRTDSINIDSATLQVGEYFHSSLVSSGNDKKSIWFKFYLPVRRGIDIELKQNANAIATKDVGFTTYFTDQCLPTSSQATAAKLTTLNQFGSSFHPCMEPGWYLVQVSSKARAMGRVYLDITTSFPYEYPAVVNAEYDAQDSAYDFGDQVVGKPGSQNVYVDYELGCYTVKDSTELFPDIGSNYLEYNQSAWFVFTSNQNHDNTQLKFSVGSGSSCSQADTFGYRIYKGDCRNGGALQLLDSSYHDWSSNHSCYSNCRDVVKDYKCLFDSGEVYSVQLLYHKDLTKTMRFRIADQTSLYAGYPKPLQGQARDLGVIQGNNDFSFGFSCESLFSNSACGNVNSPVTFGNWNYNASEWMEFELKQYSNITIDLYHGANSNHKNYSYLGFRLFSDSASSSCGVVDTSNILLQGTGTNDFNLNCLPPGKYLLQLLGIDSVWNYSSNNCNGSMQLGGDYRFELDQFPLPDQNRFALRNVGDGDTINSLNPLYNYTTYYGGYDTVACFDGILPENVCDTGRDYRKVMYRTFKVGDWDNDGDADSGMVHINGLSSAYRGRPYYDYNSLHALYKGNAIDLRAAQSVSAYPDTLTGLNKVGNCLGFNVTRQSYCLEPGEYTLVSMFDDDVIGYTERPSYNFYTASTKFNTYAKAEFIDSIDAYGNYSGALDSFTCASNPDTIDGVYCGRKNRYHVFYLDSTMVTNINIGYSPYVRAGWRFSLFTGDIRYGKSGLKLYEDGSDWSCTGYSRTTSDCRPLPPGWYTIVVSNDAAIGFDSSDIQSTSDYRNMYQYPYRIAMSTRASNVTPPKYYRPSKAAYVDSLINNNQPINYDTNYSTVAGMHLNLKKYTFPIEILECDLDTPLNHFPKGQLCDTATTDIVYYTFNLANDAFVKIYGNVSSGVDVKVFNFDVRKDSAKLATASPVQDCNFDANYVEFCNLQAGVYSLVYFVKRASGQRHTIQPVVYVDSVAHSRFDHAANAYDFGRIPGDGVPHDGKVGEVHPSDTSLPASHDMITCFTGAELSDPTYSSCYSYVQPLIYSGDTNVVMYPYDSSYYSYPDGTQYYPWRYNTKRNIWYSFTVEGRGNVTVKLNSHSSSYLGDRLRGIHFSVYQSDEDGSLSIAALKSAGKIDSTLSDGLTYISRDFTYCHYRSSNHTVSFQLPACDKIKPIRYYVLVELNNSPTQGTVPNVNRNIWLDVTYDSATIPDTKFDYYSTAGLINGINDANLLVNGSMEGYNGWTQESGVWNFARQDVTPIEGVRHLWCQSYWYYRNDTVDLTQTVSLNAYDSLIQAGVAVLNFSGYVQSANETNPDKGQIVLEYLNSSGGILSTYKSNWIASIGSWQQVARSETLPTGTKKIRVRLRSQQNSGGYNHNVYFDGFDLRITIPDSSVDTKLASKILYKGERTYFAGSTLDSTDVGRTSSSYGCNDTANAGTVWYKFECDSSGYIHYNFLYSYLSGSSTLTTYSYNTHYIRLYRTTVIGDSINGLEYVSASYNSDATFNNLLSDGHLMACIRPGTYYMSINHCGGIQCGSYTEPQIAFDFYPAQATKFDYYSTANEVNNAAGGASVFSSGTIYEGDSSYFIGGSLDTTDYGRTYYRYGCNDPAVGKTLWYKLKIDSTGYMYYNYRSTSNSSTIIYDPNRIRVYKSVVDGDSLNGLSYVAPISYTRYSTEMGYARYICVNPGTYYVQINSCDDHECVDYVTPRFVFNFHTGDFCEAAVPLQIDTLEKVADRLIVNCHTIGTDFGEDGSDMGCLYGPKGYKSSWFVVNYTDTTKVDLEFKLAEYTSAKADEIRYRTYYGNCKSLTSAPCNNNALTSFVLDCIRKGTYYVQIVTPENATGELEMSVEAKENTDTTCNPVDIFQPNAAFYYNTSCPENVIEFVNTSSRGDSIRYFWNFGYNGLTDTVLNPTIVYPPSSIEQNYTVKLLVENINYGSKDSIEIVIDVPFAPSIDVLNNDTNLCLGDSITLVGSLSHGEGFWNTGDSTDSLTVNQTGMYIYSMQDKPELLTNNSFESNPGSGSWTITSGSWSRASGYGSRDGSYSAESRHSSNTSTGILEMYQEVDVSFDSVDIDSGIAKSSISGYIRGYSSYEDEGQVILQYLDSGGTLLGIFQSGLKNYSDNWEYFEHSRTTPKKTRKLRVIIQTNKTNTATSNCYVFFDNLTLKMRSACVYKDSVYIQINPLPELTLPSDTSFCVGDSVHIGPVISYHDPYLVKDSMNATTTGTTKGSASHSAFNGYVTLTPKTINATNGQIEYEDSTMSLSDSFEISFDYYSSGARYYGLYFYLFATGTPTNIDYASGGYIVALSSYYNRTHIEWDNSRLSTNNVGLVLDNGQWHNVRIVYKAGYFEIYIDDVLVTTYTDPTSRTQGGFKFGLGAHSYYYNEYRVRNFHISKNNPQYLVITPESERTYNYAWSNVVTDSAQWFNQSGTHHVRVTDKFGCVSNYDTITVTETKQYDSLFTQDENVCSELDTFRLSTLANNGWYYGHNAVDSSGLVTTESASFGNNVIYYGVVDTFGCLTLDTGLFILDSVPQIQIDSIAAVCKNDTVTQLTVNNNDGFFYGGNYVDSTGLFYPDSVIGGSAKVYYRTAGNYCIGMDSVTIYVDTIPDASITQAGPFCLDAGVQVVQAAVNSGGRFTTTAYIDSAGNFNPNTASVGQHTIFYSFTDGNGCSATDSSIIRVDSLPNAAITSAGPFCENAGVQQLTAAVNTRGVFSSTSYLDTVGNFNPAVAQAGSHQVYYTFTDGNNCSSTDSTIVVVDSIPDAAINAVMRQCENASIVTLTAVNSGGRFSPTTYLDTAGKFDPSIAKSGSHKIFYTITDGNGCSNTDSSIIVVDSIPDASITNTSPFCENDSISKITPSSNTYGSFLQTSYIDSIGNFDPAIAKAGSHKIFYQLTDSNGCSTIDSTIILVDSIPNASIDSAGPFCLNAAPYTLSPSVSGNGRFTSTAFLDTSGNVDPGLATPGSHVVFYFVTDNNGCKNTDSITIQFDTIPDARITKSGPFCQSVDSVQLTPLTNIGGRFHGGIYVDSNGVFNPLTATQGTHPVYYSYTDNNSCSNTDSIEIVVDSLPNAGIQNPGIICKNDSIIQLSSFVSGGHFSGGSFIDSTGKFDPSATTLDSVKLYYNITDGKGCSSSDSILIAIDSIPDASINTLRICENNGIDTLKPKVNDGGVFYKTSYLDTLGVFNPALALSGQHTVYYKFVDGKGCSNVDSTAVTVDSIPDASIISAGPFCRNAEDQQLAAAVNSAGLFQKDIFIDSTGNFSPSFVASDSATIFYTFVDGNGCQNTDSTVISIDTIPNASILPSGPFCKNDTTQLLQSINTSASGRFSATTYLDTVGMFDPWIADVGLHNVFYSVIDGNQCSNTDSFTVRVDSIPDAQISPAGPFCQNGGIQKINPVTNTYGKFILTSFMDTSGNFDPMISGAGSHTIYYSLVDGAGCSNKDSVTILVDTIPDASLQTYGPFCMNDTSVQIMPRLNVGGVFNASSYIDTNGVFTPANANVGTNKVYYQFVDGNGCKNIDSTSITIDSIPDAGINATMPQCENASIITVTTVNSGGRFSPTAYLDTTGNFDPSVAKTGSHKIFYSITDGNGCSNMDSSIIVVDSIPNSKITPAGPFCENAGSQVLSPLINIGGEFDSTAYMTKSGTLNPSLAGPGNFTIYYTYQDGNNCRNIDSTVIVIDTIPDASLTPSGPYCVNDDTISIVPILNKNGDFTVSSYINSVGVFNPALAGTGLHKVIYSFTDANGCIGSDSIQVQVNDIPDASILPFAALCKNASSIAVSTVEPNGSFSGGAYISQAGLFDPENSSVGLNKVIYSLVNANGCSSSDSIDVEVYGLPTNTISLSPAKGCEKLEVELSTQIIDSLIWTINTQQYVNQTTVTDSFNASIIPVSLTVVSPQNCSIKLDTLIEVFAKPVANFSYSPTELYISDPNVDFTDLSSGIITNWDWSFGDGQNSTVQDPIHNYSDAGEYSVELKVTNNNGCFDSTIQSLFIKDEILLFYPNAISPNNDGINDVFRVSGLGYTNIKIEIFNRWGERIYQSDDFEFWDATYQGEKVQMGSYIYIMSITDNRGRKHYKKAEISVLR